MSEQEAKPVLIPRLLTFTIRQLLNVSIPFDVAATEAHADTKAMQTLARFRSGQLHIPREHWKQLHEHAQHLWRRLVHAKQAGIAIKPDAAVLLHDAPPPSEPLKHQRCYRP
jgi:hypothetical protein